MIPEMDGRGREKILERIANLSEAYTPEWKFNPGHPDLGTAAAYVYADLMKGTIDKYNRTAEKNMVEFFDRLGARQLYSEPAGGYVSFYMEGEEDQIQGEQVEKGTLLNAQSEQGETIVYSTVSPLYVTNTHICSIMCEDSAQDQIFSLYQSLEGELGEVSMAADREKNLQKHRMYFYTDVLDGIDDRAQGVLSILLDSADEKERARFLDAIVQGKLSCFAGQEFVLCRHLERQGDRILFSFPERRRPEKSEMFEREGYWFMIELEQIAKIEKSYVKEILLATVCEAVPADGIFNEMAELTSERFNPFDTSPLPYTSVYFSSRGVLGRKGAQIEVSFFVRYERNPINEPEENDGVDWKLVMKKSKMKKPKEYDITVKSVVWEYFNGSGWVRIFPDNEYSEVFDGTNDGQTVRFSFVCPEDSDTYYLPSGESYCIRARIATVDNYMKLSGYYVTPVVSGLRMKYLYEKLPSVPVLVTDNCLEQKIHEIGSGRYSVKAVYRNAQSGKSIYFGFSAPFEKQFSRILFCMDKSEQTQERDYLWEYYDGSQWSKLSCRDETVGLTRTGLLSLEKRHSFGRLTMFGQEQYWMRLRYLKSDEYPQKMIQKISLNSVMVKNLEERDPEYFLISQSEGMVCRLSFPNVYEARVWVNEIEDISGISAAQMIKEKSAVPEYDENGELVKLWVMWKEFSAEEAVRDGRYYLLDRENSCVIFGRNGGRIPTDSTGENVKIAYDTCVGAKANIPQGKKFQNSKNTGLLSSVENPMKIAGGLNRENISETLLRSARRLRMNGQLSVKEDYEFAACMMERNIIKVKCLSNVNLSGDREYGAVTLVVLLKDSEESFGQISSRLKHYFDERLGAGMDPSRFAITKPDFLNYYVNATVKVKSQQHFSQTQKEIQEELTHYFDWTDGGQMGNGWEIGELPDRMEIFNVISGIQGVEHVDGFYINVKDQDGSDIMDAELDERIRKGMVVGALAGVIIAASEN